MSEARLGNVFSERLEIVKHGLIDMPDLSVASPGAGNFATSSATAQVAHNLGFTPIIMAYFVFADSATGAIISTFCMPSFSYFGLSAGRAIWFAFDVYADSTYIYSRIQGTCTGIAINQVSSAPVLYYLLRDRGI